MRLGSSFSLFAVALFLAAQAQAASVAVMPVQGINISDGQADAIGALFTSSLALEMRASVLGPAQTKPLAVGGQTPAAIAAQLGADEYVELRAVQLGRKVSLAGIRHSRDGAELFRAETAAPSIDEIEIPAATLARALARRQPVAVVVPTSTAIESGSPAAGATKPFVKAMGVKTGIIFPFASGRSFAPIISLQFDGRFGSRDSFIEFGAGGAIPSSAESGSGTIQMGGVFAELGGSFYLSDGGVAPYLGVGVSPRLWIVDTADGGSKGNVTCTAHGQAGITLTRDYRSKLYAEVRVAQYLLGIANERDLYGNDGTTTSSTYHPTELSLQIGIGW